MIKTCKKLGKEGNVLNMTKSICENPTTSITFRGKDRKPFPCDQEQEKNAHAWYLHSTVNG